MKILHLSEAEIVELRIDESIPFITKYQLKNSASVKGVFKWGVQAWVITTNNKKAPVKSTKSSIFITRFEDI